MSFSCIIIDDDPSSVSALRRLIATHGELTLVAVFSESEKATGEMTGGRLVADITFLDIEMEDGWGIDIAHKIRDFTTVVFVTGHPNYAALSYDMEVVDFLVKPVSEERFRRSVQKVTDHLRTMKHKLPMGEYITLPVRRGKIKIHFDEIIYLESNSNYTKIFVSSGVHEVYSSMEKLQTLLPAKSFIRVHRSFLINFNKFSSYSDDLIMMINQKTLPLGRTYKRSFLELLKT